METVVIPRAALLSLGYIYIYIIYDTLKCSHGKINQFQSCLFILLCIVPTKRACLGSHILFIEVNNLGSHLFFDELVH